MSPTSRVIPIDRVLIEGMKEKTKLSPRKRLNHNFHELTEHYQRFLNVLNRGTYVRPHQHINPPKPETILVFEGIVGCILFSPDGKLLEKYIMGQGKDCYGVDILPGACHSIVCLSDTAVCFEAKLGPYDPATDKFFASWAPEEKDKNSIEFLKWMEDELLN